jgi:osmotically-inducible protein OsmY
VAVNEKVVTLTGVVPGYYQKVQAEKTALQVPGIRGLAQELDVKLAKEHDRGDTQLAESAAEHILWDMAVPAGISVTTEGGWLTLSGTVQWPYQRLAAEHAVHRLYGLKGIMNHVVVKQEATLEHIKTQIEDTLKLAAQREADRIDVRVNDGVVTLRGVVQGWSEKNDAVRAAWATPGVSKVDNFLEVGV